MQNTFIKEKIEYITKKLKNLSKLDKESYVWIGFFLFTFVLLANVIIMTFYLINSDYEYRILDNAYVEAILPGQAINQKLQLGIVKIEEVNLKEIRAGDQVIVRNDFQIDEYGVEVVTEVDAVTKEVKVTYDQIINI